MQKKKLLKSYISIGTYEAFQDEILLLARRRTSSYVCIANVHMFIEAYRDEAFNRVLNEAEIATPDGVPLIASLKLLTKYRQERVAGMDLLPSLLHEAEAKNLSVFFYGSTQDVLDKIKVKIEKEYPELKLAGFISPPFRVLSDPEKEEIVNKINQSEANLLFVALGCPKQEKWMAEHKNKVNACMIGVGGAFPVFAGMQKRAPVWMQKISLEWFFRFCQEPGRLWKRYLVTNSLFIYLILKSYIMGEK
jgi:N-acetylglucosaminyldiphosphoundecaprenol N-acetyl-beta-D-mannosaminyltransferase